MRWLAYLFPVIVLAAAAFLIVAVRGRDAVDARRERPHAPRVPAGTQAQSVFASPSGAVTVPSRNLDDVLWRVDRLRSDDQSGYETLLAEAHAVIERDEKAFLSYFQSAMRSADQLPVRRSFFLVKALLVSVPTISGPVRELLEIRRPERKSEHHVAPSLNLVKSFTLDQIAERLPPEAEQRRLQPALERVVKAEPDVAIARSAAVLLTRINGDDGVAVRRLVAGRPSVERSAIEAPNRP